MDPLGYVVAGLICAVVARVVVTGRGLSTPRAPDTDAMATRFAGVTHPTWHLPTVAAGSLVAMDLPTASGACVQRAEMVEKSGQMLSPCVEIDGHMLPDISGDEVEAWMLAQNLVTPNDRVPDAPTNEACATHKHLFEAPHAHH